MHLNVLGWDHLNITNPAALHLPQGPRTAEMVSDRRYCRIYPSRLTIECRMLAFTSLCSLHQDRNNHCCQKGTLRSCHLCRSLSIQARNGGISAMKRPIWWQYRLEWTLYTEDNLPCRDTHARIRLNCPIDWTHDHTPAFHERRLGGHHHLLDRGWSELESKHRQGETSGRFSVFLARLMA